MPTHNIPLARHAKRRIIALMTRFMTLFTVLVTVLVATLIAPPLFAQNAAESARTGASANTYYFSALPDMPVAPGLREDVETAVHFDQPEGRVIVLQASGNRSEQSVKSFYSKTLPALGWENLPDGRWRRDGEVLTLDIRTAAGQISRINLLIRPE